MTASDNVYTKMVEDQSCIEWLQEKVTECSTNNGLNKLQFSLLTLPEVWKCRHFQGYQGANAAFKESLVFSTEVPPAIFCTFYILP